MDVDVGETPTYGPDLPPRTGGHELEVLEVQLAQRAQRRLAQNAAAARVGDALVQLEEADLEETAVADVISSDEDDLALVAPASPAPSPRQRSRSRSRASAAVAAGTADDVVDLESPAEMPALPSFYVHTFEYGDVARCCMACREFFLPGQLRLGVLLQSSTEEASEALWMHAPRCLRRGNFEVTLLESVAFDSELQDQVRARVLEELAALHARHTEARWPGQAPPQLQATKPWQCQLRAEEATGLTWSMVHVPLPVVTSSAASRPGLAARAARRSAQRSPLHAALEARWAVIDAQLERAGSEELVEETWGPFMFTVGACCRSLAKVDNLMDLVPCQRLESHCAEPCAVCYEDMVLGEEVRRLPCLHYFHKACIDRWMAVKATCPLDNLNVREMIAKQGEAGAAS
ncbi:unnamed protein product [Durusdinium trenchii]|uniref:RING-type domain-containing protein n=1 Tax=Durusdinium trenchii TaxID=1381693 RepID=A0ABP0QC15_9DINO